MGVESARVLGAGLLAFVSLLSSSFLVGGAAATPTLPVSIATSANPVDVGIPFLLTAIVPGPVDGYFYNWTDSQGSSNAAPTWNLDVGTPGNLTVTLVVEDPEGDRGTASVVIAVRPPPTLTLSSPLVQVEVGVPVPFFLAVSGGVPPVTASWVASEGGSNGSGGWPADGNYSEEVDFSDPGPAWVLARVVDALGASSSTAELLTEVAPQGSAALIPNGSIGEVGWPLGALVVIQNGAPPFQWSLASSLPLVRASDSFGTFPTDGLYRWTLPFASAGTANLSLTLVDALGAVATTTAAVTVEPPLSASVSIAGVGSGVSFPVSANVTGGLPPYSYEFRLSDGEASNGSLVSPGVVTGNFDPSEPGNYSVMFRVTDVLGQNWVSTQHFRVGASPPPVSSSPTNDLSADATILALVGAVLLVGLYAFRRISKAPPSPPSPETSALPTVRTLMQRQQVIDRDTLLLLGEEAGESSDATRAALQVLIRTGEVTTELGPGNDEVLRWKGSAPEGEREEGLP